MEKHSGDTDKVKKVTLTSSIEQVLWTKKNGAPGGKVGLEIITQLVGNNSDVSIQISDKSGKTFDTIKKKMFGNKLFVEVTVPDKAKDELFAEVKFSKLSLTKKSDALNLFPQIEIKNLKWDKTEARRGDILKLTADVTNVYEGAEAEIQIWEHDSDGVHDLITKFPVVVKNKKIETNWEYEYHEDTDEIPTEEEAEQGYNPPEYFFRIVIAGVSADSGLLEFKDWIEINWVADDGTSAANRRFKLVTADGKQRNESFDDHGRIRLEDMPPGPFKIILEDE